MATDSVWVWVSIYWLSCKIKYFGQIIIKCCSLVPWSFPYVVNITKYGHGHETVLWHGTHMLLTIVYYYVQIWTLWPFLPSPVTDPGGRQGHVPLGPNYFIFMQFSAKFLQNNSLVHSLWEILGPSVITHVIRLKHLVFICPKYLTL